MATETQEAEEAIQTAREHLVGLMASEYASAELLAAQGHMDAALRALRQRDDRLAQEAERARLDQEQAESEEAILSAEYAALLDGGSLLPAGDQEV